MIKIKICGIKRIEEAKYLNMLKPDYAGFVFANSKRNVTIQQAEILRDRLDKSIKCVGVFVNEEIQNVINIAKYVRLDVIQLHGNESNEYIDELKILCKSSLMERTEIWKALGIMNNSKENLTNLIDLSSADGVLVDSICKNTFGGTGKTFDWNIAKDAVQKCTGKNIILAGGLSSNNVRNAANLVKPFAVDVSSGVEENGIKSFKKIEQFILKVRENQ